MSKGSAVVHTAFGTRQLSEGNVYYFPGTSLLINTDQSIRAIAEACGFLDEFYFSKSFIKKTGLTPSNYRKSYMLEVSSSDNDKNI